MSRWVWGGRKELLVLFPLFFGAFLRVYELGSESVWLDEAASIFFAQRDIHSLMAWTYEPHPPLYYALLHFWMGFFGMSELATRFLSAIFGMLSVFVIYRIGKLLFGVENGLYSALILAVSMFHISFSQEVRMYSLLTFSTLMSVYFFAKALKDNRLISLVCYVVASAFMISAHAYGFFALLFQNLFFFLFWTKHKSLIKRHLTAQSTVFLLFLPWLFPLFRVTSLVLKGYWIGWLSRPSILSLVDTFFAFSNYSVECFVLFGVLSLLGVMGIEKIRRMRGWKTLLEASEKSGWSILTQTSYEVIFCMLWLWVPIIVPLVVSLVMQPIYSVKYVVLASPAFYILTAKGITEIKVKWVRIVSVILVLFLSLQTLSTAYYNTVNYEQWREVAKYVEENAKPGELILVNAPWVTVPFNYYFKGPNDVKGISTVNDLRKAVTHHPKVWLILSHSIDTDPEGLIKKELDNTYMLGLEKEYVGIKLYFYTYFDE